MCTCCACTKLSQTEPLSLQLVHLSKFYFLYIQSCALHYVAHVVSLKSAKPVYILVLQVRTTAEPNRLTCSKNQARLVMLCKNM